MVQSKIFTRNMVAKWVNSLRLVNNWSENFSPVIAGTLALNTLVNEVPSGYYLARQSMFIQGVIPFDTNLILKGNIVRQKTGKNSNYTFCRTQVIMDEKILVNSDSILAKPNQKTMIKSSSEKNSLLSGNKWRCFSRREIKKFSNLSGDLNELHQGINPVVQGMLILLALEDKLATDKKKISKYNIRYFYPIKANEEISIIEGRQVIYGLVLGSNCFYLQYEEETNL